MLTLTVDQRAALASRSVMRRFFIWCKSRNFETGAPEPVGYWDDVGNVELDGRTYVGSGSIVQISTLSARGDMAIPGLTITLSGISTGVVAVVRGKAVAQAPIEVHVGLFNPATHALLPPLVPRFVGFIDDVKIKIPEAGGICTIEFICESSSRALTVRRTATRSPSSMHERDPSDNFFAYTAAQRTKPIYFGRAGPADATTGIGTRTAFRE